MWRISCFHCVCWQEFIKLEIKFLPFSNSWYQSNAKFLDTNACDTIVVSTFAAEGVSLIKHH